jgi:hypothetical protein
MALVEDAERKNKDRVLWINAQQPMVTALVYVYDIVAVDRSYALVGSSRRFHRGGNFACGILACVEE